MLVLSRGGSSVNKQDEIWVYTVPVPDHMAYQTLRVWSGQYGYIVIRSDYLVNYSVAAYTGKRMQKTVELIQTQCLSFNMLVRSMGS